ALVALTERTEVAEGVDAGVVSVAPRELERVVADLLDVADREIAAGHELDRAAVSLAVRAGAVPPEDLVRQDGLVPVGPLDLHYEGAVGRLHARGCGPEVVGHVVISDAGA